MDAADGTIDTATIDASNIDAADAGVDAAGDGGIEIDGSPSLCSPNHPLRCEGSNLVRCNGDGTAEVSETCLLGCRAVELRCCDVDPSNGLAQYLDMAAAEPDFDLGTMAVINTESGAVVANGGGGASGCILSVQCTGEDGHLDATRAAGGMPCTASQGSGGPGGHGTRVLAESARASAVGWYWLDTAAVVSAASASTPHPAVFA